MGSAALETEDDDGSEIELEDVPVEIADENPDSEEVVEDE